MRVKAFWKAAMLTAIPPMPDVRESILKLKYFRHASLNSKPADLEITNLYFST